MSDLLLVAGQVCGWQCLCPRKPELFPVSSLPLSTTLELRGVSVRVGTWLLLRAPESSGREGAASPAPAACSGEAALVWGFAF